MTSHILVTYATRTGSTPGVADAIAATLRDSGATVTVLPMTDVTDLTPYDAVVAGSAIQASTWLPEALDFVRTHRAALEHKPFAAFLVCMTLVMPNKGARDKVPEFMQSVRDIVQPVSEGYFAGALDLGKIEQPLARWGFRISVWMGVWKEGDHRDWDAIRTWAQEIYPLLTVSDRAASTG